MSNNNLSVRETKRARFAQPNRKRKLSIMMVIAVGAVVLVVVGIALLSRPGGMQAAQPSTAQLSAAAPTEATAVQGDNVRLPLSAFDDGVARFYTVEVDVTPVQFFALRSSDGVVRTAFNACDVCYPSHLGFRQEGDEMVCNNCGRRFPSTMIGEVSGGCNPSPLVSIVEGDELVVRLSDIATGIGYFR